MNSAVFLRNMGMSGTPSIFIKVAARSRVSALGSAKVPLAAYTSIMGMVVFSCSSARREASGKCRGESVYDGKWTVTEHHAADKTVCAKAYPGPAPDWQAERSALPLEVRPIGGLRLVGEFEPVVQPGGLPHRVPDRFAPRDWTGEDAALEDHVLVHQFGEGLSGVVRDCRPPCGDGDRIPRRRWGVPIVAHLANAQPPTGAVARVNRLVASGLRHGFLAGRARTWTCSPCGPN